MRYLEIQALGCFINISFINSSLFIFSFLRKYFSLCLNQKTFLCFNSIRNVFSKFSSVKLGRTSSNVILNCCLNICCHVSDLLQEDAEMDAMVAMRRLDELGVSGGGI